MATVQPITREVYVAKYSQSCRRVGLDESRYDSNAISATVGDSVVVFKYEPDALGAWHRRAAMNKGSAGRLDAGGESLEEFIDLVQDSDNSEAESDSDDEPEAPKLPAVYTIVAGVNVSDEFLQKVFTFVQSSLPSSKSSFIKIPTDTAGGATSFQVILDVDGSVSYVPALPEDDAVFTNYSYDQAEARQAE
eukprot:TRINITY_DN15204_c0_g1_i1.p1 TRINITY_DN15204_c0_g1~~TRINITY_DN15204_c0_g1_i1.p1  ORF type:complete len:192 (+),score=40.62 TRINITY_DN15204_c0_g1_i1:342-917(+)